MDNNEDVREEEGFRVPDVIRRPDLDDHAVDKDYVPEGFKTQEGFLKDMREKYQADLEFDHDNREAALDDKKFAAGDQWDPIVLEHRKGLPNLVINSVPQFTAQLVGDWREDRNAVKVLPVEDADIDTAKVRSDLIRSIEHKSRAQRVYDSGFESMIQCADGAWKVCVEYAGEDVFDQDIVLRPIDDALSCVWDYLSVDPTGRDARHVFVDDLLPRKEFERLYPDSLPSELGSDLQKGLRSQGWIDNDTVRVTEYWRMIERDRLLVLFEDGSIRAIEEDDVVEDLFERYGQPMRTRVAPCRYAQMHLVSGFEILEGPYEYKLDRVPVVRVTGRVVNVGGKRIRYGLVRFMKDSVRLRNFHRSVAAEQLGYAPKAQWIASEDSVEGREDAFRKAHLSRDPLLIFNEGTEKPDRVDPPELQAALLNEAATNVQDMKDVTGIHDASLGIKSNETSGRAIMARQREGDIASLTYYDNANASILETGDIINQLIPQVYDGTRVIRLMGEDEEPTLMRINDPMDPDSPDLSVGKYDVAISTGASYTTRRVEAATAMMEAVQAYPELMQIAGDLVAKAQDWPGAQELAERLKKTIPPEFLEEGAPPLPPEIQQQLEQLSMEVQALQQQNEELQDNKDVEHRKLDIDAYDAETKRVKVAIDSELALEELIQKAVSDALSSVDISPPVEVNA